ncbi:MAG: sigma-70 family RNA polymerase sigma factor [Eubacterium sp.]|nr:sigma-70 family RNA polymerase sigma factor [Eubacterium sp.]MBR7072991.1 sigma-70 family RNA polymerase sigma factor [Eubacterium sp.]
MDFVDSYYYNLGVMNSGNTDYDKARSKAFSLVLPYIMEQKLTERQRSCIECKYMLGKSQQETAEMLNLTQPTVSRHIASAKKELNEELKYCFAAVTAALGEYDRLGQSCGY